MAVGLPDWPMNSPPRLSCAPERRGKPPVGDAPDRCCSIMSPPACMLVMSRAMSSKLRLGIRVEADRCWLGLISPGWMGMMEDSWLPGSACGPGVVPDLAGGVNRERSGRLRDRCSGVCVLDTRAWEPPGEEAASGSG